MKTKVNLSIERQLLQEAKRYATKKNSSLSEIVRQYLQNLVQNTKQESVIDIVEKMKVPAIPNDKDLKEDYYEEIEEKYGA